MRVAVVTWAADDPGGHAARLLEEASERFEVIAVVPTLAESLAEKVTWRRTPRWPERPARARWLALAAGANAALRRERVDLVHEITPLPLIRGPVDLVTPFYSYTGLYQALAGRPPGAAPFAWRLSRQTLVRIERWTYSPRRTRMLAALCEGQKAELERLFGGVPVVTVPRGTNTERFRPPLPGERERLRAELGISGGEHVAILIARAERYKGLPLALAALAELRRRGRRPPLLLVSTPDKRWAPRLARELGVADRVRFLGWRPGIDRHLRAADVFVLPTAYETYCQSAHEAAATALPVIATPVSGIRELIEEGRAGIAVALDPVPIADALARLEDDPGLRARLGRSGRRWVEGEDLSRFARETVDLYERLLAEPADRSSSGTGVAARSSSPGRS
jgi:glycosyltransferase involved in cell wall biosynthesis